MFSLTCADLEPLLRDTFTDPEAAWAAMDRARPCWATPLSRSARRLDRRWTEDLVQQAQVALVDRARRQGGLTRPPDCDRHDPARWLQTTLINFARTAARNERARSAAGRPPIDTAAEPPETVEATLIQRQRHAALQEALARLRGPPTRLLAALCLYAPDAVDAALVVRAAAWRPGSDEGLMRDADETRARLAAWQDEHGLDPATSAARLALAHVLRSDHPGPVDAWKRENPQDAERARELVGKWARRALEQLRRREAP